MSIFLTLMPHAAIDSPAVDPSAPGIHSLAVTLNDQEVCGILRIPTSLAEETDTTLAAVLLALPGARPLIDSEQLTSTDFLAYPIPTHINGTHVSHASSLPHVDLFSLCRFTVTPTPLGLSPPRFLGCSERAISPGFAPRSRNRTKSTLHMDPMPLKSFRVAV
jgi:hypothetical protein